MGPVIWGEKKTKTVNISDNREAHPMNLIKNAEEGTFSQHKWLSDGSLSL